MNQNRYVTGGLLEFIPRKAKPMKQQLATKQNFDSLYSLISNNSRRIEELSYDITHILFHIGLQRNQFTAQRFIPCPKKPTYFKRLWLAIRGK